MKTRLGFVSNSSSASFIIKVKTKKLQLLSEEDRDIINNNISITDKNDYYYTFEGYTSIYNDINDIPQEIKEVMLILSSNGIKFNYKINEQG